MFRLSFLLIILLHLAVSGLAADKFSRHDFPPGFIFGSGTSAYQVNHFYLIYFVLCFMFKFIHNKKSLLERLLLLYYQIYYKKRDKIIWLIGGRSSKWRWEDSKYLGYLCTRGSGFLTFWMKISLQNSTEMEYACVAFLRFISNHFPF